MKNAYRLEITATCPVDRRPDVYACTVRSRRAIPVDRILEAVAALAGRELYQEDLTRELHRALAARVETVGLHSGVEVRSVAGRAK